MAPAINAQHGLLDQLRLHTLQRRRTLGETAQDVNFRDGRCAGLQRRKICGQSVQQCLIEHAFACLCPLARSEDLILEGFQFRRNESLRRFDRLPAQVLGRDFIGLTAVHFDEEALYAIEAEFQTGQAAAFAFALFKVNQELLGVAAERPQFIQFRVEPWSNHAAFTKVVGRGLVDRAVKQGVLFMMIVYADSELLQQGRRCAGENAPQ
jgi:hypothetical protein